MDIVIKKSDDVMVLYVNGDIYDEDVEIFNEEIKKVMKSGANIKVLFVFNSLNILCSAAFEALIKTHVALKKAGGRMSIANISDSVKKLFQITKMDKVVPLYLSENEALSDLK